MTELPPDNFSGRDVAIVRYVGGEARISIPEAQAMRAQLVEHLRRSSLEERDRLVRLTERAPIFMDGDGTVRIGAWLLQAQGAELILRYRQISNAPASRAYTAFFTKKGAGWQLQDISEDRIRRAR